MSTVGSTRARAALALVTLVVASCKRSPAPPVPAALASAPGGGGPEVVSLASTDVSSAPVAPPPPPRCHAVTPPGGTAARITLGPGAPVAPTPVPTGATGPTGEDSETDDDVALPFAPEIGVGTALDVGFAVSALVPEKGSTSAVVAVLSPGAPAGSRIELSKVHGDVSPPRIAAFGKSLIAAIPDGAPHGTLVRLARIDDALGGPGTAHVKWGAEIEQGSDESEALALEVGTKTAVLVWDDWSAPRGVEVVKAATFSPNDVSKVAPTTLLSSDQEDAEGPLLAPRLGGFWAAWTARAKGIAKTTGQTPGEPPPGEPIEPVDNAPRWIVLAPLDESGKPAGAPIRVTAKDAHVQGFDLAPAADGGALVAFRDDATTPGTSGGTVRLVVVRADGSIDARAISDEDVGPAIPSLLVDPAALGASPGWLALTADSGEARLLALDAQGRGLDSLLGEPALGTATLLAVRGAELLATRPHGKGVEAFVVACDKGPAPAPAAPRPF